MRHSLFFIGVSLTIFCISAGARAATYQLTCSNAGTDNLQASLQGTANWTTPASSAQVQPGDIVDLTNICQGDVAMVNAAGVPITGVTLTNQSGSTTAGSDGINGQVQVFNGQLTLQGLVLESGQNGDTMSNDNGEFANVFVHDGGSVMLNGDTIGPGPLIGLYVLRTSSAQLLSVTVSGVGTPNFPNENDGIRIEANSAASLTRTAGPATTVLNNAGNGITLLGGSSLNFFDGTVHDNAGSQIFVSKGSSATISGVGVETTSTASPQPPLVEVIGSSTAAIDTGSLIQNTSGGTAAGGLLVASASSVVLNSATFNTTGLPQPVIEASGGSALLLAGGNSVTAAASGGTAIQIDHSSNLMQEPATAAGYATIAAEAINGGGAVQVQSSMDLGQGDIGSDPSIDWSITAPSSFTVQQNSSFRLSGGVTISGAKVRLQQGSNGFFNCSNSAAQSCANGPNNVGIVCVNSANNPTAHVTGIMTGSGSPETDTSVSPNISVYTLNDVLAGDSLATHPGQTNACLSF